jgi:hypothetical protein
VGLSAVPKEEKKKKGTFYTLPKTVDKNNVFSKICFSSEFFSPVEQVARRVHHVQRDRQNGQRLHLLDALPPQEVPSGTGSIALANFKYISMV